ncbi:MAG: site-specific DNA-methyltransferase [Candidatus Aminicenantales bacterium]
MKLVRELGAEYQLGLKESLIFQGDASQILNKLPENFFRCVVTSPPYWGLRDYGIIGQIGAENDPDEYIQRLVIVFNQVKRVLKNDGTLWLNIGDSYTSGNRSYRAPDKKNPIRAMAFRAKTPQGLKPKDLVGIPWRLAFALQRAGWYLRSDIIWDKPNCMPESVKDRPTRSHEYIFLLTKNLHYYYNIKNIIDKNGRNRRTVWAIPTEAFSGAHFATFPAALIEPCILAGTNQDEWVLDPFFGSGTVGAVCERLNRKYVGIELNPRYIRIAINRIKNTDRPLFPMIKGHIK